MSQELIVIEEAKALTAFNAGSIEQLVSEVEEIARSIVLDASTAAGRKEIISVAYKVAQSKTFLDNVGKKIVEDWKKKSAVMDKERKKAWERLEKLQIEIRRPVTEFEEREKARVAGHEQAILSMEQLANAPHDNSQNAAAALVCLNLEDTTKREEFSDRAAEVKLRCQEILKAKIAALQQSEAEKAELERLRKEAEERAQQDRERQIAEEAARKAREEAERKANAEREAAEARAKKAEEDAKASAMKAEEDAKRAVAAAEEQARRAIEAAAEEARAVKAAEEKRAANVEHRRSINRDILADLVAAGLTEDDAKLVVIAINKGVLRHVSVRF